MIGRLKGILVDKQPPWLLVDVAGVGYEVEAPMSTFYALPGTGGPVTLQVHLAMRDESPVLFGFLTEAERALFRSLIRVSGVGPKMALGLLSGISAGEFRRCVEQRDTATLTRLPGVGRKTAERLVMEMQDRIGVAAAVLPAGGTAAAGGTAPATDARSEAAGALVALGYRPAEASRLLDGLDTAGQTSETLIRAALQKAVR